ncbi:MAG TPA: peptide chain release factor 2 [Thermodesulfatator sp.]|nr:peptide chain release factor 2 [Thermodesulfatator sp.]
MTLHPAELRAELESLKGRLDLLRGIFDPASKEKRLQELEQELIKEGFWERPEAKDILKERASLQEQLSEWQELNQEFDDAWTLLELAREEKDEGALEEVRQQIGLLKKKVSQQELKQFLADPADRNNAIVTIHAGAGGTEAQDWAEMLLRMYLRWAERRGYRTKIIDLLPGEEAGIKSVTFIVEGPYAYGHLKGESGIHRLVRLSPFDTAHKRHTSFASVSVIPEIAEDIHIDLNEKDLRIETFRASGAGGQHVNKVESAVRITHIPTGIVVQCQNERSQHRNKAIALKILRARLYELERKKREEERQRLQGEKKEIAWGSQIRSYVLHPYRLIKDHRTGVEIGNVEAVLDGDLDPFIKAYLVSKDRAA